MPVTSKDVRNPGRAEGTGSAEVLRQNLPGLSQDNKEASVSGARGWVGRDISVS